MNKTLHKAAKRASQKILAGVRAAGGFNFVGASEWRRRHLLILGYHGVSLDDEHKWDPELYVPRAFLRRRFEILRDGGYKVLPLQEGLERCAKDTLPPRSVVLTFDDGLSDFAQVVAPMLAEFGFPATVYVTTYYAEKQWPVAPPILSYLLWKAGNRLWSFEWPTVGIRGVRADDLRTLRYRMLNQLRRFCDERGKSGYDRWVLTQSLADKLKVNLDAIGRYRILHIMTCQEIGAVARGGVDVQLHTHRHRVPLDEALFQAEIMENRDRLEAWTGRPAEHFCYPSGFVRGEFLPWLRRLGVRSAVTCEPGLYTTAGNILLIPRYIDTTLQPELAFECWLSGLCGALRSVLRARVKMQWRGIG